MRVSRWMQGMVGGYENETRIKGGEQITETKRRFQLFRSFGGHAAGAPPRCHATPPVKRRHPRLLAHDQAALRSK